MSRDRSESLGWIYRELGSVEREMAVGDTPSLRSADRRLNRLEAWLVVKESAGEVEWAEPASSVATARGHLERLHYRVREAEAAYQQALYHLQAANLEPLTRSRRRANLHTYLGLTWLMGASTADWRQAVAHFDESIQLRESDPDRSEGLLWGLSAAWINRGDALSRCGDPDSLEEAIRCHERAVTLLSGFDLSSNTPCRSRLALCQLNLGSVKSDLVTRHARSTPTEALAHFAEATLILREGAERGIEESKRMLAVALANTARSRLLLDPGQAATSEGEARESLHWIADPDPGDWEMVKLGMVARCTLCLALRTKGDHPDSATEITDLVEDGLKSLAGYLSLGGILETFDTLAGQLFRLGAEAYASHLPRHLADFLLDHLDPDRGASGLERSPACQTAAVEVLWKATATLKQDGFADIGTGPYDRRVELEIEWNDCRERLAEIRSLHFTA